jgi:hypothetical protein
MAASQPNRSLGGKMSYFAQASKGFIEIVEADSPPKPVKSFLKRPYYDTWLGRSQTRKIPIISFEGGLVIATLSPRKFGNLTGHTLRPGTVWKLTAEFVQQLKEK